MTRTEARRIIGEMRQGRYFAGPCSGKDWQVIPLPGGSFVRIGKAPDQEEQSVISESEAIAFFVCLPFDAAQSMLR